MGNSKGGGGAAKSSIGKPKGAIGKPKGGNFTFTTNKAGVGAAGRSANVGSMPQGIKKAGKKK